MNYNQYVEHVFGKRFCGFPDSNSGIYFIDKCKYSEIVIEGVNTNDMVIRF